MRRTLTVVLCAGVILAWWFSQGLHVKAQAGRPEAAENGDVNGDLSQGHRGRRLPAELDLRGRTGAGTDRRCGQP